jgi:Flp pilus assembly protein TadB
MRDNVESGRIADVLTKRRSDGSLTNSRSPARAVETSAPPQWRRSLADLERWAVAKPNIASLTLSVAYVVAVAALVAVLAASAVNSVLGIGVLVLFTAMVLVCGAVGVYALIPEHRARYRRPGSGLSR